ncbi:SpaH/EbpB family LPXTG-anchored major pilin [Agrococcus sp. HG114]|uniref:SpaH/EbpB family LPXTG-anchored major pilin n=1 Tax=Agrococcus sp. HG114 TaxID=2969757 RepID=UPI00215B0CFE|nr:SpaH/EbpB family LPXTG-anchored major pilin [Agrococcus sp. HG114]MCR8670916.1 SpaH/EbpB family LPXTG-anchored major pilin [Agrococcus sp. HG114]
MASTKKGLTARVAAGFGAVALATLTALGGALPASAAPNIDADARGSIHIHKLEQPVGAGSVGTGRPLDASVITSAAVPGVDFTVTQVTSLDVLDNGTWAALGAGLDGRAVVDDAADYTFGTPITGTTGDDGLVEFLDLPVGVYLVQEDVPAPSVEGPNVVIQPAPFLVVLPQADEQTGDWFYDVHVYPKNTTALATKTVADADHQVLGTAVEWTIGSTAPVPSQGTSLDSYAVTDALAAELDYVEGSVEVRVAGTALVATDDYEVAAPAGAGGTLTVTFTADGRAALLANPGAEVTLSFDTLVVGIGSGTIANTGAVVINGTSVPTSTASDSWGAVELFKHDAADRGLEGAVFELRDGSGAPMLDAANQPIRYTSDEDGMIRIAGLRTDGQTALGYQLVEITAPSGYILPTDEADRVHAFSVAPGAPAGIEVSVENEQVPAYALPITGGSGQAAFMIGGAGLILGALGFVLTRRRRAAAEA